MMLIKKIQYSFKYMGMNSIIPILVNFFIFFIITVRNISSIMFIEKTIILIETLVPVFASWWIMLLLNNILEKNNVEVYFSYPTSRYEYGIINVIVFMLLYLGNVLVLFIAVEAITGYKILFSLFFVQIALQCIFFSALGFFLMCFFEAIEISILFLLLYFTFVTFKMTPNTEIISIYLHSARIPDTQCILELILKSLYISIPLMIIGQMILNQTIPSKKKL